MPAIWAAISRFADDRLYFNGSAGLRQLTADGRVTRASATSMEVFGVSRNFVYGTSSFFGTTPFPGVMRISRATGAAEPVPGISIGVVSGGVSNLAVDADDNIYAGRRGEIVRCRNAHR